MIVIKENENECKHSISKSIGEPEPMITRTVNVNHLNLEILKPVLIFKKTLGDTIKIIPLLLNVHEVNYYWFMGNLSKPTFCKERVPLPQ